MSLADMSQWFGADLVPSSTGDLEAATGTLRGQQRILRRLLTNPGDYIFHPDYGAGVPAFVGQTLDINRITAVVRGQIALEAAVATRPAPVITVAPIAGADGGGIFVSIAYTDAATGAPETLSFNVDK